MAERHAEVTRTMLALLAEGDAVAQSRWFEAGSQPIHVLEAGEGPPLLLLHGAGGGAANWFALFAALARTHHVIAPDLPGFGLSPGRAFAPPLGLAVADLLIDWLTTRGLPAVHVMGTSLGGLIALRMAARARSRIRSVVLIDAAGLGTDLPAPVRIATLPVARRFAASTSRAGLALFFTVYLTSSVIPRGRRARLLAYMRACARAGGGETLAAHMAQFASLRGQSEVVGDDELRALTRPVLLLWGALDRFIPVAHGRHAAAVLPDARLVTIPGVGHSPNWEAPERVVYEALAFLGGQAP